MCVNGRTSYSRRPSFTGLILLSGLFYRNLLCFCCTSYYRFVIYSSEPSSNILRVVPPALGSMLDFSEVYWQSQSKYAALFIGKSRNTEGEFLSTLCAKTPFRYEVVRSSSKCRWSIYPISIKCRWSIYRTSRKCRVTLRVVHKVERSSPTVRKTKIKLTYCLYRICKNHTYYTWPFAHQRHINYNPCVVYMYAIKHQYVIFAVVISCLTIINCYIMTSIFQCTKHIR